MSLASYHCSTPGSVFCSLLGAAGRRGRRGALAAAVSLEDPRRRELAELVADHVLGHEQLDEDPPVVDQEGVADEVRHDGTVARPGLDRLLVSAALLALDLGQQALIDVRPFLQ